MQQSRFALVLVVALVLIAGCHAPDLNSPDVVRLRGVMEKVRPLYSPMGPIMTGDWLSYYSEKGQTFQQYLASHPKIPDRKRRVLYVRPLGAFSPVQHRIANLTADYLGCFFGLPVRIEPPLPLGRVPAWAHRFNPRMDTEQIQTDYLMDLLKEDMPDDAFAQLGLIATDLYPDKPMNFVFGEASIRARVGVWSLHRLGEPESGEAELRGALVRTLKTSSHELGHMFSIPHCTSYQCVMNGSNSIYELDGHPLDTCPECMAKICWATGSDPRRRFERLADFFFRQGMDAQRLAFEKPLVALAGPDLPGKNRRK